ncbi:hypothetical protein PG997_008223 [Apiospora hydei]|uniref:Uncharacterized protein n=1 Tax=Apiospora hydei TaxID=1337664 RepID=A0ABR1WD69_9PEZI
MSQTQQAYVVYPAVFDENTIGDGSDYLSAVIAEIHKGGGGGGGRGGGGGGGGGNGGGRGGGGARGGGGGSSSGGGTARNNHCSCDSLRGWRIASIVLIALFGAFILAVIGWMIWRIYQAGCTPQNNRIRGRSSRDQSQRRDQAGNNPQSLALGILGSG